MGYGSCRSSSSLSVEPTSAEKSNGSSNDVLLSLYDQLIYNGGRTDDVNSAQTVEGTTRTTIASIPFKSGDTLIVYIRPTAKLQHNTKTTQIFNSSGGVLDVPGLVTRSALKSNINIAYPGSSAGAQNPQPYKYSWTGSPDNSTTIVNNRECTQDFTNLTDPTIFDGHVWKITISL